MLLSSLFIVLQLYLQKVQNVIGAIPPPNEFFFTQRLDHYNPQNLKTFQQKYLVYNGSWNKSDNGPIFHYAGNEAPIETFWYNTGFMFDIADEFGALIVFTELRYYGVSLPFGNDSFTVPNLKYYTIEQVVQDYAYFMTQFKRDIYKTPQSKVVTFGGSYGGILAAALRIHHAEIFDVALAASAPIPMVFNAANSTFFFQIVTNDYYNVNPQCPDIVRKGYANLIDLGKDANNYNTISNTFNLCDTITNMSDIIHLQYWSRNALLVLAQFDYPYATEFFGSLPAYPVNKACDILVENKGNALLALAKASGLFYNASANYTLDCYDQFEEFVFCADQTGCGADPIDKILADYIQCTEFVSAFDTNNVTDMFPPTIWNINNLTKYCMENYGLTPNIEWVQMWYPLELQKTGVTNIIFSNGELDPFIGGGYASNLSDKLPAIVIANGAHHLDLRSKNANDPASVIQARALEVQYIKEWLDMS